MTQKLNWLILGIAIQGWSISALAQDCAPEFVYESESVTIRVDEIGYGQTAGETFQIAIRNAEDGQCSVSVRAAYSMLSVGAEESSLVLSADGSVLEILSNDAAPGSGNTDFLVGSLPQGSYGTTVNFQASVGANWGVRSGIETRELTLSLVNETGLVVDTMRLLVTVDILPAVELRIVGATGAGAVSRINLGNISSDRTSTSDPFALRVLSTGPYSITFESDNQGALLRTGGSDTVPYVLAMNGQEVDLSGSTPTLFSSGTGSLGELHSLLVSVPPTFSIAGDYSDRVNVMLSAI